jgi:hypothetical protein
MSWKEFKAEWGPWLAYYLLCLLFGILAGVLAI